MFDRFLNSPQGSNASEQWITFQKREICMGDTSFQSKQLKSYLQNLRLWFTKLILKPLKFIEPILTNIF